MIDQAHKLISDLRNEFEQYKNEQRVILQQMQQEILDLKNSLPDQRQGEPGQIAVLNQQKNGYTWRMSPFSISFEIGLNQNSTSFKLEGITWGHVIPFDKVVKDSNNAFDANLHAYRIPVAGKWLFIGQLQHNSNINGGFLYVGILKGGRSFYGNGFYKDIKKGELLSTSGEIDCQEGDLIYLLAYHQSEFHSQNTYLQGFYLSP